MTIEEEEVLATAPVLAFVEIVSKFFPAPKFGGNEDDERIWLRALNEILYGYDDDVLLEAAKIIIRTRDPDKDGTMFPKPFECVTACDKAKDLKRVRSTPLLETRNAISKREREEADKISWGDDRQKLARELCHGEMGRRAAREGWLPQLYDYCRENAHLPKDNNAIAELIRDARSFQALKAEIEAMPANDPLIVAICKGFLQRIARGDDLKASVLSKRG